MENEIKICPACDTETVEPVCPSCKMLTEEKCDVCGQAVSNCICEDDVDQS